MDYAYAIADLVISRAGAVLFQNFVCLLNRVLFLPNVAEDHQTQNALALVKHEAAVMIKDVEAQFNLIPKAIELIKNEMSCKNSAKIF
jgi:UDP-N-acetylglucosamine--N-acetylmuramyl-(pentapeptide) pyrophosphoryl-undecaprenol N-acetylglucosamine transferase